MKPNSLSVIAALGVAMLAVLGQSDVLQSDEAENSAAVDARMEELHIRLCGTKA